MATPIDTAQPFYLQSQVGTTVNPDFQGGTLRDDQNNVTDSNNYTVENFPTNTIDAFGHTTTFSGSFTGAGPLTITSSVPNGTVVFTSASAVSGALTIDNGATMQWGAGGAGFLVGGGNAVTDNGALVMDFGGGGIAGAVPISGAGTVRIESGSLNDSGASTYTGVTTIEAAGLLLLSGGGSIANSTNVTVIGALDISGTTAGASIVALNGSGGVSLGAQTLTLTSASGTFSGVMADGGLSGGTGGALTIAGGAETLTGANTYTGATTINSGAALQLGAGGTTGTVAGAIVDNGLVLFNYSGAVTAANSFSGSGSALVVAGTVVVTSGSALSGVVAIDNGATMQWGAGGPDFLVGGGDAVVDDGALVMDFGGGGVSGSIPILGIGRVEIQSGLLSLTDASTYTGVTTIDASGSLALTGTGSIADSSNVIVNGAFDISGTAAGASIVTLNGSGGVSLGGQILTLTAASGTFSGVMADGGAYGGTGGGLTIASGTETLTGANTYTGATRVSLGATLKLGLGGGLTVTGAMAGAGTLALTGGTVAFGAGTALSIAKVTEAAGSTASFTTNLNVGDLWTQTGGTVTVATGDRANFLASGNSFAGTLAGAGVIAFAGGTDALTGTTLSASDVIVGGGKVTLSGAVTISKELTVTSPTLTIGAAGATLSGGGAVYLSTLATSAIIGTSATTTLTNKEIIRGTGKLGDGQLTIINAAGGIIDGELTTGLTINTGTGTLSNAGTIENTNTGGVAITGAMTNTGTLEVTKGVLTVDGAVSGAGILRIGGGTAYFGGTFAENVAFIGTTGVLELAKSVSYTGAITGFSKTGTTALDLRDITFTSGTTKATYSGTTASGTLTVTDGTHTAKIHLTGNYTGSSWVLSKDSGGGTIVIDPVKPVARTTPLLIQSTAGFGSGASASHAPVLSANGAERTMLATPHALAR